MKNLRKKGILALLMGSIIAAQVQAVYAEKHFIDSGERLPQTVSSLPEKGEEYYTEQARFYDKQAQEAREKARSIAIRNGTHLNGLWVSLTLFSVVVTTFTLIMVIAYSEDIHKRMNKNDALLEKVLAGLKI